MREVFKTEFLKIRKRPVFIIYLILPIIIFILGETIFHPFMERAIENLVSMGKSYSWAFIYVFLGHFGIFNNIMLPILCLRYFEIEEKNKCRNNIFTLPIKTTALYNAKILVITLYVAANTIIMGALLTLGAITCPKINFPDYLQLFFAFGGTLLFALIYFMIVNITKNRILFLLIFIMIFVIKGMFDRDCIFLQTWDYDVANTHGIHITALYYVLTPVYIIIFFILGYPAFKHTAYGKI
ncbi:MAG: ABC transporter permease [Bacteroidales bacterium]|jgi:hypothetical protein|nr:ABC transporter permease [Bacteroidales bacterium]